MGVFPLFYYVFLSLRTGKVFVAVLDFILGLVGKPVALDLVYFFVSVLSETQEQKVVVNEGKLPSIVVSGVSPLQIHIMEIFFLFNFLFLCIFNEFMLLVRLGVLRNREEQGIDQRVELL